MPIDFNVKKALDKQKHDNAARQVQEQARNNAKGVDLESIRHQDDRGADAFGNAVSKAINRVIDQAKKERKPIKEEEAEYRRARDREYERRQAIEKIEREDRAKSDREYHLQQMAKAKTAEEKAKIQKDIDESIQNDLFYEELVNKEKAEASELQPKVEQEAQKKSNTAVSSNEVDQQKPTKKNKEQINELKEESPADNDVHNASVASLISFDADEPPAQPKKHSQPQQDLHNQSVAGLVDANADIMPHPTEQQTQPIDVDEDGVLVGSEDLPLTPEDEKIVQDVKARTKAKTSAKRSANKQKATNSTEPQVANSEQPELDNPWMGYTRVGKNATEQQALKRIRSSQNKLLTNVLKVMDAYTHLFRSGALSDNAKEHGFDSDQPGHIVDSETTGLRKLRMARQAMIKRFLDPSSVKIESEHVEFVKDEFKNKYARIRYSDNVENALKAISNLYDNMEYYYVMQLIQLRAGLGVDISQHIGSVLEKDFALTDDQVIELCRDIVKSQKQYGHPLAIVDGYPAGTRDDSGRYVVINGTRAYPLGYMPITLADKLLESKELQGTNLTQFEKNIAESWINETYPEMRSNTKGNADVQRRAIENMMRAMAEIDHMNIDELGVPTLSSMSLMALKAEQEQAGNDKDLAQGFMGRQRAILEAAEFAEYNLPTTHDERMRASDDANANGHRRSITKWFADQNKKPASKIFRAYTHYANTMSSMRIEIILSSLLEAPKNALEDVASITLNGAISKAMAKKRGIDTSKYQYNETVDEIAIQPDSMEAFAVADAIWKTLGKKGLSFYFQQGYKLNKQDLGNFMEVIRGKDSKMETAIRNCEQFWYKLMLGEGIMKKHESRAFFKNALMSSMENEYTNQGDTLITNDSVIDTYRIHGDGESVIREMLQTDAGYTAFMYSGKTTYGRKTPRSYALHRFYTANGVTEAAFRNIFTRFAEYGYGKNAAMLPMSNSLGYITDLGVSNILEKVGWDTNYRCYYAGGLQNAALGLRKNFVYDVVRLADNLAIAMLQMQIINAMGGLHEPEKEEMLTNWAEWRIGENGVPVRYAWWIDDLSGLGLPLGASILAAQKTGNLELGWQIFINAVAEFNEGSVAMDVIDIFNDPTRRFKALNRRLGIDVTQDDYLQPNSPEDWASAVLEASTANFIGSLAPAAVNEILPWSKDYLFAPGREAHSASTLYDTRYGKSLDEAKKNYDTYQVADYADYIRRNKSQNNVLYAALMNFMHGKDSDTGYLYTQQPISTKTDDYALARSRQFNIDIKSKDYPKDPEARKKYAYALAEYDINYLTGNYATARDAAASGFVLNGETRRVLYDYCYAQMSQAEKLRDETIANNPRMKNEAWDIWKQSNAFYKDFMNNWLKSNDIPSSSQKYKRMETNSHSYYVSKDGKTPSDIIQYLLGNADKKTYYYGDKRSLSPISSPVSKGKSFDFNTIPFWHNKFTDTKAIANDMKSIDMKLGANAGKNLAEMTFAGIGDHKAGFDETLRIPTDGSVAPIIDSPMGGRPYIPTYNSFDSLSNLTPEEFEKALGYKSSIPSKKDKQSNDGTSPANYRSGGRYGYPRSRKRYYGSSGGGYASTYNPKIYSVSRDVQSDRAAGMRVNAPYKATSTYLRPDFETKGSREAYKRGDF